LAIDCATKNDLQIKRLLMRINIIPNLKSLKWFSNAHIKQAKKEIKGIGDVPRTPYIHIAGNTGVAINTRTMETVMSAYVVNR